MLQKNQQPHFNMTQKTSVFLCQLLLLLVCLTATAQEKQTPKAAVPFPAASQFANTQLTYKIIPAANHTFCYDVLADGKILIHQPSKPGLPGNEGFTTKTAAEKVAQLIITKIKKGEMPPSVTTEELKKLNVL